MKKCVFFVLHLLHEQFHQLVGIAVENLPYLADVFAILLGTHQPLTAALAAVDVVLQTQAMLVSLDCFT